MRLYALSCGQIVHDKSLFIAALPKGERIATPICSWLIAHPGGNVIFDTGCHPDAGREPSYWGGLTKVFQPIVGPDDNIVTQLAKAGFLPSDIAIVVNSHLHMDHCGGNQFFPRARFYVQADELDAARDPANEGRGYFKLDWDHGLDYQPISGDLDIFGDRSVEIVRTHGHSVGHQSLVVRLPKSGTMVLTGDACDLIENIRGMLLPRMLVDAEATTRSLQLLRSIEEAERGTIIPSHDIDFWQAVKHPPQYYD